MEKYERLSLPVVIAFAVFLYGGIVIGGLTKNEPVNYQSHSEQVVAAGSKQG